MFLDFSLSSEIWKWIIISSAILVAILIVFLACFPFFRKKYQVKHFKDSYYKRIRKVAEIKDYYLINNLVLKNDNQVICKIDHILFGEKYIYVIKDRYYRGGISGASDDNVWIFVNKKEEKKEISNPMQMNMLRVNKLSLMTQIDESFFISIVIINDDCIVNDISKLCDERSFIVSRKKFPQLIKTIESRNVKKMNENQLSYAVKDIKKLYGSIGSDEQED